MFPRFRVGRQNQSLHTRSYSTQDIFNQFNELYRTSNSPHVDYGQDGRDPTSPTGTGIHKAVSFPDGATGRALSDK